MKPGQWTTEWLWLLGLGVLLSLHFWFPEIGTGTVHDTYSTTARGKKAFYLLARRRADLDVRRNRQPLLRLMPRIEDESYSTLLCLTGPQRYPTDAEQHRLLRWVARGGTLVMAARRDEPEFSLDGLGISVERRGDAGSSSQESGVSRQKAVGDGQFAGARIRQPTRRPDDQPPQPTTDDGQPTANPTAPVVTPLVASENLRWESSARIDAPAEAERLVEWDGTVQAVAVKHGSGRVVVVASDYIFSNESLATGDNSVLAFRLLEATGPVQQVYFDESLNASGTPKAVGLLLEPTLRPLTIQLLLVLLLFAWRGSRRFGPILPQEIAARHNIVDHTDTVGTLYYKSHDGTTALRAYLRQLVTELHLKTFKGREDRVLEPIAVRLGTSTEEVRNELMQAVRAARTSRLERREAAKLIRGLARIRRAGHAAGGE